MAFYASPDVAIKEEDLSANVQGVSTSVGAAVGQFVWGPVLQATTVSDESTLVSKFGKPSDATFKDWFSVYNFLAYSNNCRVVRVVSANAKNACDVALEATLIKNLTDFGNLLPTLAGTGKTAKAFAKCPGAFGNTIKVYLYDKASVTGTVLEPFLDRVMEDNEVAFGVFVNGNPVEYGIYSKVAGTKDYQGVSNYVINQVNNTSAYAFLIEKNIIKQTVPGTYDVINFALTLSGGVDGDAVSDDERKFGWDIFKSDVSEDISLPFQGAGSALVGAYIVENVCETRKDCFASLSPMEGDVLSQTPVEGMKTTRQVYGATSYGQMDGNYKYQYDAYNDKYRWVPLNGDIAGLMAMTDAEEEPWFSPGGKRIKNCVKLAFQPTKAERDELYKHNINIVTTFPDEGTILYGDRTLVSNSAFGKINVRRLFIVIEKAISKYARKVMFKINDEFTRTSFVQSVEPYLRDVQGRRGIYDFLVIADDRVNTPEVIDRDEFKARIFVKPARSINFVELTFVATRTDAVFEELI